MTSRQFFGLWWRLRPRDFSRSKWFRLGVAIDGLRGSLLMPFTHPRLWWFCRRCQFAVAFGLPLPKCDRERGILRA